MVMASELTKEEINRKLLHVLAVILPLSIFYGPELIGKPKVFVSWVFAVMFLLFLFIEWMRLKVDSFHSQFCRYFGGMMREVESRQLTGATYVVGGSSICSVIALHSHKSEATVFLGLTLFILGDAVAALVGKGFGRIRVGQKTLEGCLGCFIFCVLLAWIVFPQLPDFLEAWGGPFSMVQILLVSAAVSILELFPIRLGKVVLNDNLYVPAAVSLIALIMP
tara:strand:+ start:549 stop:1214 length:666 start_codon:yes stop_codon:yes gene_type:complete